MTVMSRGTSNGNCSGNAKARRRQKRYLLETYRADVDVIVIPLHGEPGHDEAGKLLDAAIDAFPPPAELVRYIGRLPGGSMPGAQLWAVPLGYGEIACRCYRCGRLLTFCTLERDRIVSGKRGGRYVRSNLRPVCGGPAGCNIVTGNYERWDNAPAFRHHVNAGT